MSKDFDRDYDHHPPRTEGEASCHAEVRSAVRECAEVLDALCPGGRELALAHTHLESAMMWANAAIARGRYDEDTEGA